MHPAQHLQLRGDNLHSPAASAFLEFSTNQTHAAEGALHDQLQGVHGHRRNIH
ncbi:hypothetical protein ACFPRL_09455 [Pseudoclavibacter helvolus]